jgi:hypothetical protein
MPGGDYFTDEAFHRRRHTMSTTKSEIRDPVLVGLIEALLHAAAAEVRRVAEHCDAERKYEAANAALLDAREALAVARRRHGAGDDRRSLEYHGRLYRLDRDPGSDEWSVVSSPLAVQPSV